MIGRRRGRWGALVVAGMLAAIGVLPSSAWAGAGKLPRDFFGVFPVGNNPSLAELDRMATGGVRVLRTSFAWRSVEPSPPSLLTDNPISEALRWRRLDELVGNAAMNGIRVIPTLEGPPAWVSDLPEEPPLDSSADRNAWQSFVRSAVRRYGRGGEFWELFTLLNRGVRPLPITHWQIWNEQNGRNHWFPKPSPKEFADLLRLSSKAIRGVDPKAQIVLGGMFGTPNAGNKPSIYSWLYLRRLYKEGAAGDFDAVSAHPYSPTMRGIRIQINLLRHEMTKAGDSAKPMWITELGWDTSGLHTGPRVPSATEEGQASKLRRSLELILKHRKEWKVPGITWFSWRDTDGDPKCAPCQSAGLFRWNHTPKPAWSEFARLTGGRP